MACSRLGDALARTRPRHCQATASGTCPGRHLGLSSSDQATCSPPGLSLGSQIFDLGGLGGHVLLEQIMTTELRVEYNDDPKARREMLKS